MLRRLFRQYLINSILKKLRWIDRWNGYLMGDLNWMSVDDFVDINDSIWQIENKVIDIESKMK
jgi:hypothetical protein